MATPAWSVVRIERKPPSDVELTCLDGQYPATATLYDSANNVYDVVTVCTDVEEPDPCVLLNILGESHTPNDWTAECGA